MTDESGTTYEYDELGRVISKDAPDFGKVTYTYDLISGMDEGCHYELQYDPAGATRTVYDRQNRVVKVTTEGADGKKDVVEISYYDNGARKQVTYGDGSTEKYTFYDNNLVKSVTNALADGTVVDSFTYTYDGAGNQISKTEVSNGVERGTTTYTYDVQNRLGSVTEPDGSTITYTEDGATTATVLENTYDLRNQLIKSVTEETTINNIYNASGYRVAKAVTKDGRTEKTYFLYDGNNVIMEAYKNGVTTKST